MALELELESEEPEDVVTVTLYGCYDWETGKAREVKIDSVDKQIASAFGANGDICSNQLLIKTYNEIYGREPIFYRDNILSNVEIREALEFEVIDRYDFDYIKLLADYKVAALQTLGFPIARHLMTESNIDKMLNNLSNDIPDCTGEDVDYTDNDCSYE